MKSKQGKKDFMAIKADLKNANHRPNWNFLYDSLFDIGILDSLISIIINCVSTTSK